MFKNKYPTAKPEALSVSAQAIQQTIKEIRETNGLDLHSFLLLRKGTMLWEEYFHEGMKECRHVLHSVSKSFTSTAIGLAQDEGLLSVNDKLYDFFPEHRGLCDSDYKRELTLRHLLMMSSGFQNHERELMFYLLEGNLTAAALSQPVIYKPGTVFDYYTVGTFLLSAAFSKVCPEGIHSYLRRKLFDPMGFGASHWNVDTDGIPLGGTGLFLTAYDMTRLGQLYIQKGVWKGRRLLSKDYAEAAGAKQIDNTHAGGADWISGYGYLFWNNSFGGYRADGMKGQYIIVLPKQELVIVMTSNLDNMEIPLRAVAAHLLPNVQ
jgi:CubicO group peptidase (beta-lactamase class C family)